MIQLPDCKIVFVSGPVASGKTYLIRHFLKTQNRTVGFDYSGELMNEQGMETIIASPANLLRRLQQNPYMFRIAYVPGANAYDDFTWVLWSLWHTPTQKQLFVDECHAIFPVTGMEQEAETAIRFARHAKLGILGASQRIADVSKLFTSCCRMTILFKTHEIRDLRAIDERWGCSDMVGNLRPLIYDDAKGITIQSPECVVCEQGKSPRVEDLSGL